MEPIIYEDRKFYIYGRKKRKCSSNVFFILFANTYPLDLVSNFCLITKEIRIKKNEKISSLLLIKLVIFNFDYSQLVQCSK